MPAPGRGIAVLHTGTVEGCDGYELTVDIGGTWYDLPFLDGIDTSVGARVFVLFTGRSGLVLGNPGFCDAGY
jgi:hypothetical protein